MKRVVSVVLSLILAVLCGCSSGLNGKKLQKIMENSGYSVSECEAASLESMVKLDDGTFVLFSIKDGGEKKYTTAVVDKDESSLTEFSTGFKPLEILLEYIYLEGHSMNVQTFNALAEYMIEYGEDCFSDGDIAKEYIRDITGERGIVSTADAQRAVEDGVHKVFSDEKREKRYSVIFEKGNANPLFYGVYEIKQVYNWSDIFDESLYGSWAEASDEAAKTRMIEMYGEPYSVRAVWTAYDSELKEAGIYNSEAEFLMQENRPQEEEVAQEPETELFPETEADEPENMSGLYRVRKSADEASTQLGAFSDFDNAKSVADAHKAEGYMVFDMDGNVLYTPLD